MAKRIIAKDGDESLRKRCKDVTVFDDKLWTMLDDMYEKKKKTKKQNKTKKTKHCRRQTA